VTDSFLYLNGLRVHYLHWGEDRDLPPIVLLHGLASNARIWHAVGPRLAAAGFRVLAPDQRSHGQTDAPDPAAPPLALNDFLADLLAFFEAADLERPLLVGHSGGATLAIAAAARLTHGTRAPRGLVLLDGGMMQLDQLPGVTWESTLARLTPPRLAGMPLADLLAHFERPGGPWQPDDDDLAAILANFEITEDAAGVERIAPHLSFERHLEIVRLIWEFPTFDRLAQVQCPILMLPCRQGPLPADDFKLTALAAAQAAALAAEIIWLNDTIHDAPLQRPERVAAEIVTFARTQTTD
jgi:pimeloyl-ACP methyl ester carboxylesterase